MFQYGFRRENTFFFFFFNNRTVGCFSNGDDPPLDIGNHGGFLADITPISAPPISVTVNK